MLSALPASIPPPAANCPKAGPLPAQASCERPVGRLAAALLADDANLDEQLAALEACSEFEPGIVRILRAERAPLCADELALPVVGANATGRDEQDAALATGASAPSLALQRILVGLGLGARLRRTVQEAPAAPPAVTRAELESYFSEKLFPWATQQSQGIFELAQAGSKLSGYARGVVAIESAMADLRFVDMARRVPLPPDMSSDEEIAEIYYSSLDEALEPRKTRGRDAALIGLSEFARAGMTQGPRLAIARELITRVYAGNRMRALDALLTPPGPSCSEETPLEQVALALETPHAGVLIAPLQPSPAVTPCLLTRGVPTFLRRSLEASSSSQDALYLGVAEFSLGQTYFMAENFQNAEAAFSRALDTETSSLEPAQVQAAQLLRALSVGIMSGPQSPVELFRYGSRFPAPLGELTLLDALGAGSGRTAGMAAFDAAYLRELAPKEGSPQFWREVAQGYTTAANKLSGKDKQEAVARSRAAKQTADSLQKQLD